MGTSSKIYVARMIEKEFFLTNRNIEHRLESCTRSVLFFLRDVQTVTWRQAGGVKGLEVGGGRKIDQCC